MLQLQVARGHVRILFYRVLGKLRLAFLIVLVDDAQTKRLKEFLFELLVHSLRVIGCDESHLFRQPGIEVAHLPLLQFSSTGYRMSPRGRCSPKDESHRVDRGPGSLPT